MPFAAINQVKIYYEVSGVGDAIVFLHGFKLDHRVMKILSNRLKQRYKTIILDLRGHGQSSKPEGDYTYPHLLTDIKELLTFLRIESAVFVGYSMGGELAMQFASEYPEYATGLVLIATGLRYPPDINSNENHSKQVIQNNPGLIKKYETVIAAPKKLVPNYVERKLSVELARFDFRERANSLRVPVLILAGEVDHYFPISIQHEMKAAIKNSELYILKNCGHEIVFGRMEETVKIIRNFLKDLEGKRLNVINGSGKDI